MRARARKQAHIVRCRDELEACGRGGRGAGGRGEEGVQEVVVVREAEGEGCVEVVDGDGVWGGAGVVEEDYVVVLVRG